MKRISKAITAGAVCALAIPALIAAQENDESLAPYTVMPGRDSSPQVEAYHSIYEDTGGIYTVQPGSTETQTTERPVDITPEGTMDFSGTVRSPQFGVMDSAAAPRDITQPSGFADRGISTVQTDNRDLNNNNLTNDEEITEPRTSYYTGFDWTGSNRNARFGPDINNTGQYYSDFSFTGGNRVDRSETMATERIDDNSTTDDYYSEFNWTGSALSETTPQRTTTTDRTRSSTTRDRNTMSDSDRAGSYYSDFGWTGGTTPSASDEVRGSTNITGSSGVSSTSGSSSGSSGGSQ